MIRVLFVCLGNICRSPMAEALFQHKVALAGLSGSIETDSAATGPWQIGNAPHIGTLRVLARNNIVYEHRARQLTIQDLEGFEYVLTMDESNYADVCALGPGISAPRRIMEFAPHFDELEVPDPYYNGRFEEVYALLDAATDGLLEAIRAEQGL